MNTVFNIKNVGAAYDSNEVLHAVDLEIQKGDFTSIIGPNGAGKSTLLKLMAGDIRATKGSIIFKERVMGQYRQSDLARERSVVYQSFEHIPAFTVNEFLKMGRFPYQKFFQIGSTKEDREIIEGMMGITDIYHLRNRLLSELSGGELQLVSIAHSLVQNNEVVLLDEPISHLDIKHATRIMDLLYNLNLKGSTIVAVLHDINIASDYSKKVCALKNGSLFFCDAPEVVIKYDIIEELYGTSCIVLENPISKKPYSYPVPKYILDNDDV